MSRLAFDRGGLLRCALRGWTKGKPTIALYLSLDLCLREDSGSDFRFSFRFLEKKSPPRFAKRRRNRGAMFARALSSSGYFGGTPCAEIGRAGRCKFEKLKGNTRVWKKRSVLEAFKAFRALLESFFFFTKRLTARPSTFLDTIINFRSFVSKFDETASTILFLFLFSNFPFDSSIRRSRDIVEDASREGCKATVGTEEQRRWRKGEVSALAWSRGGRKGEGARRPRATERTTDEENKKKRRISRGEPHKTREESESETKSKRDENQPESRPSSLREKV